MRNLAAGMAIVLAICSTAAASLSAAALAWPESDLFGSAGLAAVHEARAGRHAALADGDLTARAAARSDTLRTLAVAPATSTAWLRLAYLDSLDPPGFGPAGNRALAASYAVAPYGPDDTPWRLAFAFNHWPQLDRSNRLLAIDELTIVGRNADSTRLRQAVSDPAGRLALALTLDALHPAKPSTG